MKNLFKKIMKFFTVEDKNNSITTFFTIIICMIVSWFALGFIFKYIAFETVFKIATMIYFVRLWVRLEK